MKFSDVLFEWLMCTVLAFGIAAVIALGLFLIVMVFLEIFAKDGAQ